MDRNLKKEIEKALVRVDFGSVEIYVQDKVVTQITIRSIKKTSMEIESDHNNGTTTKRIFLKNNETN